MVVIGVSMHKLMCVFINIIFFFKKQTYKFTVFYTQVHTSPDDINVSSKFQSSM